MRRRNITTLRVALIIFILALTVFEFPSLFTNRHISEESGPQGMSEGNRTEIPPENIVPEPLSIPLEYSIDVPFTSQAPLLNWDATHEEACEEASLLMMYYWWSKKTITSTGNTDKEILDLVSYEQLHGYGVSITLSELSNVSSGYYKMNTGVAVIENVDDIKSIIASGKPVIVGAAGKILPNPNFRNGGPNYHMLLIKGYSKTGFITNDPGTRKGENFYYTNDELFVAIHDWNSSNILLGDKNILYPSTE